MRMRLRGYIPGRETGALCGDCSQMEMALSACSLEKTTAEDTHKVISHNQQVKVARSYCKCRQVDTS